MKKITTAMASAMLMGAAVTASAGAPGVPFPYSKMGNIMPTSYNPNLFVQEKVAFSLLEGAMQAAEGVVYTRGCAGASGKWDLSVEVFDDGTGSLDASTLGTSQLSLTGVAAKIIQSPGGTRVTVTGSGNLKGNTVAPYSGTSYFNGPGSMMVESATFNVRSVNNTLDRLSGTVIKDFWKVTPRLSMPTSVERVRYDFPVIFDWGLQSVSKNLVPQDKWWQRSKANRSDGVIGYTKFEKDRIYSAKNGGTCAIDIEIQGNNDADFFGQSGTLTIYKPQVEK